VTAGTYEEFCARLTPARDTPAEEAPDTAA
jgi:hypothetical protein